MSGGARDRSETEVYAAAVAVASSEADVSAGASARVSKGVWSGQRPLTLEIVGSWGVEEGWEREEGAHEKQ